jgi:hypothetical protein
MRFLTASVSEPDPKHAPRSVSGNWRSGSLTLAVRERLSYWLPPTWQSSAIIWLVRAVRRGVDTPTALRSTSAHQMMRSIGLLTHELISCGGVTGSALVT